MALIIIWLVANGLAASVASDDNYQIQSSAVISTNLDTPDISQNEKLSAVAVHPVGFEISKSLTFPSVEAAEVPARWREDNHSYPLNCTLLL